MCIIWNVRCSCTDLYGVGAGGFIVVYSMNDIISCTVQYLNRFLGLFNDHPFISKLFRIQSDSWLRMEEAEIQTTQTFRFKTCWSSLDSRGKVLNITIEVHFLIFMYQQFFKISPPPASEALVQNYNQF
jgi:hypothetical protein